MEIDYEVLVEKWLAWDKNEKTRGEIQELWVKKDYEALKSRMCGRLAFGTAGVRAKMEAGFCRLNDLTIVMLTHGFAKHLKNFFHGCKNPTVVIGFDGRHNSKRWADLAANVFILNGIRVFHFSKCCPTPLVSFVTTSSDCLAGLMITASHNPKQDNGYKVYWTNGAQILEPHDSEICRIAYEMDANDKYWDTSELRSHRLFAEADFEFNNYFEKESSLCHYKSLNEKCPIRFTYSAFHGVGLPFALRILKEFGFPTENVIVVQEHAEPDPDFPTVPFPNPEEGMKVLTIPIATAQKSHSTVILANDPDADRFQLAEQQKDGKWKVFTGNEMGALICWWVWHCWREQNPNGDPSNVYILNSVVSSSIARTIAAKEGFQVQQCLTGFKWLGNLADELIGRGKTVILGWEEAIGFMLSSNTREKDGITAAAVFAELASYLHSNGLSLVEQLSNIYSKYGYHLICSSYWIVPDHTVTNRIFQKIRQDKKILPVVMSSNMITFTSPDGSWVTLRASGTEPKIKYYIEFKSSPGKSEKDLAGMQKELRELEHAVVDNLLEPKLNGLTARS